MTLNFSKIVNKVLTESVEINQIVQALNNHNYAIIEYEGSNAAKKKGYPAKLKNRKNKYSKNQYLNDYKNQGNGRAPFDSNRTYVDTEKKNSGGRLIQPYAYGLTKSGKPCVRAFQVSGNSLRGTPKWKLFLVERIKSWKNTDMKFIEPPKEQGYFNAPDYNSNGDLGMSTVIQQVKFNKSISSTEREKNNIDNLQNNSNFKISTLGNNGKFTGYRSAVQNAIKSTNKEHENGYFANDKNKKSYDNAANIPSTGPVDFDNNDSYQDDEDDENWEDYLNNKGNNFYELSKNESKLFNNLVVFCEKNKIKNII